MTISCTGTNWYTARDKSGNIGNGRTHAEAIADCIKSIMKALEWARK